MSRWTDEELRELVTLWPTNSASQIAKQLSRRRSAICRKAERLWQEGLPFIPESEKDWIMGRTTAEVLKWPEK